MKEKKVVTNLIWRFLEKCGKQGVSLFVSIILARLLTPDAYGTVALISVFTAILQVFIDSGLGNALIQKKGADDQDFSTVFYFNILLCFILFCLMYFFSPFIALFYNRAELTNMIRCSSLILLISGFKNIQIAYISKNLQFKKFFFATIIGTIVAAIIGIWMAYHGYGAWALVIQNVSNHLIDTVILWFIVNWRPRLYFSFSRLKQLFSFGWKLLISRLIDHLYNELRQLIIGKYYSPSDLAFFNKGKQFSEIFNNNVNASIDSVMFPVLSQEQDNIESLKKLTKKSISMSIFISAPLLIGLAAIANTFIELLLTDKWLPCVPYLRIFCVVWLLEPINSANLNAIKATGNSALFLKLNAICRVVCFSILFLSMKLGSLILAGSTLLGTLISIIINSYPNKKIINYGLLEQIKDIYPSLLISIFMGLAISFFERLYLSNFLLIIIQVTVGAAIYIFGSKMFNSECYLYIKHLAKSLFIKS